MAATSAAGPGGFSYAQAVRTRQQTATGARMPDTESSGEAPTSTGPALSKDWAEESESSARAKAQRSAEEETAKPSSVERMKLDNKLPSQSSGVSSPDMAASATSHDDASSSAPNGSSLSSWEAKSQSSDTIVPTEPAWIMERKERQSNTNPEPKSGDTTITPEQKSVVLHEAPPPVVNIWAKRAEQAKAKTTTAPTPARSVSAPTQASNKQTETAQPTPEKQQKPSPSTVKSDNSRSRQQETPSETTNSWNNRQGEKATAARPPPVKDETSWPTPETSQEAERKSSQTHAVDDKVDEDASSGKPRKKTEWKAIPVVPNIIWETSNVPRGGRGAAHGERSSRGGANSRGRGSRGALNSSPTSHTDPSTQVSRSPRLSSTDRSDMPPPSVPAQNKSTESRKPRTPNGVSDADEQREKRLEPLQTQTEAKTEQKPEHKREASSLDNAFTASDSRQLDFPSAAEPRKDGRNLDTKEFTFSGRGAKRGGRGRGGLRGDLNGHALAYQNGFDMSPHYVPQSPGRAGFSPGYRPPRGNSGRSQSVLDPMRYNGMFPGYMLPGYPSPMMNYGAYAPPTPSLEHLAPDYVQQVMPTTISQIDYYFSVDNLAKDEFLRKNMDSQGFVMLDTVMGFNRMKHITQDVELLKVACISSSVVDIFTGNEDGKLRLRKIIDWERWVLPEADRVPDAQTSGPVQVLCLGRPSYPPQMTMRQHVPLPSITTFRPTDRRSADFAYGLSHQMSSFVMAPPEFMNGSPTIDQSADEYRGSPMSARARETTNSENTHASTEQLDDADAFPDDKIEQLTVCVKLGRSSPHMTPSSRTFSNGSIDADSVHGSSETAVTVNGGSHPSEDGRSISEQPQQPKAQDLSFLWIKYDDQPLDSMPNDLSTEPYHQLHTKALSQRSVAGHETCPRDLDVLYQFWSHFLIRNFNNQMYSEFKQLALEDAKERNSHAGQQNLTKYYDQALQSNSIIPLRVAKDYLALAKADTTKDAFRNLHRSWRNGALNLRSRKRISDLVDAELRQLLES